MGSRAGYDWTWEVKQVHKLADPGTPIELITLIDKWKKTFEELALEPMYPEKGAGFVFQYKGLAYDVSSGEFGVSDSVFARLSRQIQDELVDMGAEKVFYTGMFD